jgi:hypothetical protein
MPPFNQQYIRPPYLGGGPNEAPMPQRAMPMQPMQPMAPQYPSPQIPPMQPQIPQGVNPQMLPRPQMPQQMMQGLRGGGQITDAEGMAIQKMMMEEAERLEMLEKSMQMKRVRGMLGE